MIRELNARSIYAGEKKKELEDLLKDELHGVQRVPALLFTSPNKTLESINCVGYEILGFEPLHDIGKNIENLFCELPDHLPTNEASKLKAILELCIGGKDTKRTIDYRCALIAVSNQLQSSVNSKVQLLLDTLVEIQEIAYNSEEHRTPRSVLRFHNLTWHHAMLCKSVIGFSLKQMSIRKFYGNYFHNITTHAPIQNRLISGRSANTEEQERVFNSINNITRMTSSNHPEHIIGNVFIRVQAEKELKVEQPSTSDTQEAYVSKLASSLPNFGNTVIPKQMLAKNYRPWQAHLERICDFLLAGEGIWWRTCNNGDIEFFDAKGNSEAVPKGPTLHHFRSSNFKKEEAYLKCCWQACLEKKIKMPIEVLQVENDEGNMVFVDTTVAVTCTTNQEHEEGNKIGCADVIAVDEPGHGCDAVVDNGDAVVGNCDAVAACHAVVGCDSVVGCDTEVDLCNAVADCVDIVGTGSGRGPRAVDCNSGGEQNIVGCNVRLVEVSQENVACFENDCQDEANENALANSEAGTMQAKNRDKGTFTNLLV